MAVYLTLHEGRSALDAEPVFATKDPRLIRVVLDEMTRRLRGESKEKTTRPKTLRLEDSQQN